jgi:hypothetical protein
MLRLETAPSSSFGKLNMDRYMADRPTNKKDQDEEVRPHYRVIQSMAINLSEYTFCRLKAWRGAIDNVKMQMLHQENRLMNAELAEGGLGSLWLQQNVVLEQVNIFIFIYFSLHCTVAVFNIMCVLLHFWGICITGHEALFGSDG